MSEKSPQTTEGRSDGAESLEIRVDESDTRDLRILYRSDIVFALLYGFLFLWGVLLTLLAIY